MKILRGIAALTLLVGTLVALASARPADAAEEGPLRLLAQQQVSARVVDLTFETPALSGPTPVRVFLPDGYDPSGSTRYPVIYLLHGGAANFAAWTRIGALELTAGLPVITVMPDAGRSAWYTDWYNNGLGGTPMWETYHVDQLIPWIDAHYPTVGTRGGRAIAGLSSGGFGAMSYATRHPDVFVAAAGYSAAVDTNTPPVVAGKVIDGLAAQDGGGPGSLFGLRETDEVRWRGKNPWDLASNLRDMAVTLRAGNGEAGGTYGGGGLADPGGFFLEKVTYDMSLSMHNRLDELGIEHIWDDYGAGTHSDPYWRRDLERTLPTFLAAFAENQPDPTSFEYRSIDPAYGIYDWSIELERQALEFSSIDVTSDQEFSVSGSGVASVRTPASFQPGDIYLVTMEQEPSVVGGDSAVDPSMVTADADGRLEIPVPLGIANPLQQQFTVDHQSPATVIRTTVVNIEPTEPVTEETTIEYRGATSGQVTDPAELAARLTTNGGPVTGAEVTFAFQGADLRAVTDADGVASVSADVVGPARETTITVAFGGDGTHEASLAEARFVVTTEATRLALRGARDGGGATFEVRLSDDDGMAVSGRTVVFAVDGKAAGESTTDDTGMAAVRLAKAPKQGAVVSARFDGDGSYEAVGASLTWRNQGAEATAESGAATAVTTQTASSTRTPAPSPVLLVFAVAVLALLSISTLKGTGK